jgi:hypothetical protein
MLYMVGAPKDEPWLRLWLSLVPGQAHPCAWRGLSSSSSRLQQQNPQPGGIVVIIIVHNIRSRVTTNENIFEIISKINFEIYVLKLKRIGKISLWAFLTWAKGSVRVCTTPVERSGNIPLPAPSAVMHVNMQQLPMYLLYSFEYKPPVSPPWAEKCVYHCTTPKGVE